MSRIIKKKILAPDIHLIELEAPVAAKKAKPGQFVVVRADEKGERIPLTIADSDSTKGTITIIFQVVGASTFVLSKFKEGDEILDLCAPLGKPADIKKFGTVLCIGGGVGIPEIYPVARAYKKTGNRVISILGSRSKDYILLEDKIKKVSDEYYITTDDGSAGRKGFVSDVLQEILEKEQVDLVSAVGPTIMMKVVSDITRPRNIKTLVSLNPIMLDATGMCGVCRVTVGGETKFACVDGPEFDGHQVDFKELMSRQKIYLDMEKSSMETAKQSPCSGENKDCRCRT